MSELTLPGVPTANGVPRRFADAKRLCSLDRPEGEARISATMSQFSFASFDRLMLSALVTGSRWSGFTHGGFSHRWSRTSPVGIGPTYCS